MSSPQLTSASDSIGHHVLRTVATALIIAWIAFIGVMPQAANDFWLQAKIGEMILHDWFIPQTVLFAFTPIKDATFNAHEWLPSVFFHVLIRLFGESALPLILGGLVLTLYATLVSLIRYKSGGNLPWALLLGAVAVGVANGRNYLRPELLTLILLSLYWFVLERYRQTTTLTCWAGALIIVTVWANTHGSFILAPIIAGLYSLGTMLDRYRKPQPDRVDSKATPRQFAAIAITTLSCTMLTPFGWELLQFVFDFSRSHFARTYVVEWLPTFDPLLYERRPWRIGIAGLILMLGFTLSYWKKLSAVEILMVLLFSALAFQAFRFLVYGGMVFAFAAAGLPPRHWAGPRGQIRGYAFTLGFSILFLGLTVSYGNALGAYPHHYSRQESFSAAIKQALSNPAMRGNVLTSYELGAELVYRAYPRLQPSIDSRIDSYGDQYTAFHDQVLSNDQLLQAFVREYDVRYALLTYRDYIEFRQLPSVRAGGWEPVLFDSRTALLRRVRKNP